MVSIVIRTYNEGKYLTRLIKAIYGQISNYDFEIIVVDSGSTDNTLSIAKEYGCHIVEIEKNNFTFGRSLNYGCKIAKGRFIVFISAHCIPYNNKWLNELILPFLENGVALSYGRQIGNELTKFSEHQVFAKYFPQNQEDQQGEYFCNNANSSIKKELWEQHNFDENLTGLEDLDWAKYFFNKGFKIVYSPESIIYHIHEESWGKIRIRYEREAYALKDIMPEIHINFIDLIRYTTGAIINDLKILATNRSNFSKIWSIILFRVNQYYGSYKGNHIHRKISRQKKEQFFYYK